MAYYTVTCYRGERGAGIEQIHIQPPLNNTQRREIRTAEVNDRSLIDCGISIKNTDTETIVDCLKLHEIEATQGREFQAMPLAAEIADILVDIKEAAYVSRAIGNLASSTSQTVSVN